MGLIYRKLNGQRIETSVFHRLAALSFSRFRQIERCNFKHEKYFLIKSRHTRCSTRFNL